MRAQDLRKRYALDAVSFEAMLVAQQRRCAICGHANPDCVDHCHVTRKVRGILCRACNTGLGQFYDDPKLILAAIKYLEEA